MDKIYFIGSYKNCMHYSDGVDVYELQDYRWGFTPIISMDDLEHIDESLKLTDEQKLKYDDSYSDLPALISIYKGK